MKLTYYLVYHLFPFGDMVIIDELYTFVSGDPKTIVLTFYVNPMNLKKLFITIILFVACLQTFSQHHGLTFEDAKKQGITIEYLDSIYKSAVHVDSSQAVFKSETEQKAMYESYVKLLQDFGKFLTANNFNWEKPTKCFNRIYFSSDGTIDYFLYIFTTKNVKTDDQLSQEKQLEFNRLLNLFIKDYKISLTANSKFAQCSPATYMPKE